MKTKAPQAKAKKQATVSSVGPSKADEARWRAESDLRTMQSMAEIKADPGRIRAAEAMLQKQLAAVKNLKGKA